MTQLGYERVGCALIIATWLLSIVITGACALGISWIIRAVWP